MWRLTAFGARLEHGLFYYANIRLIVEIIAF